MTEFTQVEAFEKCQLDIDRSIAEWIDDLRQADQTFYNLMMIEIWSIAQTMDELRPGFWAEYMKNRQAVFKQHLEERRQQETRIETRPLHKHGVAHKVSPLKLMLEQPNQEPPATEMVSSFSQDLEHELPKINQSLRSSAAPASKKASPSSVPPVVTGSTVAGAVTSPVSLATLPHLIQFPAIKVMSSLEYMDENAMDNTQGLDHIAIACWTTTHFLVASGAHAELKLALTDSINLKPGQKIACCLGFRLTGISTAQVQLAKPLRTYKGLVATWLKQTGTTEVAIQLSNESAQPYVIQAGQALCRLEFYCSANSFQIHQPVPATSIAS